MKRVCILGLFLLAPALAAGPLRAENNDRPNRPATGLCTQVGIDVVNDGLSYENGVVRASGSWRAPGGPAKGVLLEYHLDGDRYQAETQSGSAGQWRFAEEIKECGTHNFEIIAFPSVVENGRTVYCLPLGKMARTIFELPCQQEMTVQLDCTGWTCKDKRCTGTCTGAAAGGQFGYVALIGIDDARYLALPFSLTGPWTQTVTCAPGERIFFKVRDNRGTGAFSPVAQRPCGQ